MTRATKIDPVVPDASIIVKWYIEKEYSAQARALREDYVNGLIEIMIPSLVAYEVVNALRYSGAFGASDLKKSQKAWKTTNFLRWPSGESM